MSVRMPSPMARISLRATFRPASARDRLLGKLVDRHVGLAGIDHLAAILFIDLRERAGAVDEVVAALDQMIGVGAEHGELASGKLAQQALIVLRRLGLVVEQPGADDKLGVFGIDAREIQSLKIGRSRSGPRWKMRAPSCLASSWRVRSPEETVAS